jgi:DNA (cytosine-5)-methyltransferase 1
MSTKQTSLLGDSFKPSKRKRGNGTQDRISRYNELKRSLDKEVFNQNWLSVDTQKVSKKRSGFNFIDLFSGAGGLSLGFKQAGFNKLLSIEVDSDASKTIEKNFPESNHIEDRIENVTFKQIDKALNGKVVHIVCGGPPCQGFSVAGLRNPKDPRNKLFREFIRIVRHLKPLYVVMENVPGILTMEKGKVYREILSQFSEAGYPDTSVRILEAATFGVPQLRTRAIFIGNRLGLKNPYPIEILKPIEYKTIKSAIDDLKSRPFNPEIGHWWTKHSEKMEKRISRVKPGDSLYDTYRDAYKRQYADAPSMTIKENHGGVHIHYELNRVLSVREMARLQTFPDDFFFMVLISVDIGR